MRSSLARPLRPIWALVTLIVCAVVGFGAFTALGVGGGSDDGKAVLPKPPRRMTLTERRVYENSIREAGGTTASGQQLSDNQPIPPARFAGPIRRFKRYAVGELGQMNEDVTRLTAALAHGDRAAARARWRAAFADYVSLGAVYGAFGRFDAEIAGLPGGLARGTRDAHFAGLHRIERGLWSSAAPSTLVPVSERLGAAVRGLRASIPSRHVDVLAYTLRAHEILEDAQRDFLSGLDVPYSGEGVLATAASLRATDVVIGTLRPLLAGRQSLYPVIHGLGQLRAALARVRSAHGGRLPTNDRLSRHERELLAAGIGGALEQLQQIPGDLETHDAPLIPALKKTGHAS